MLHKKIPLKILSYGIIGCGNAALKNASAIQGDQVSRLVAVYDMSPLRGRVFAKKFHCEVKPSVSALLADNSIDIVVLCTPHDTHANLVIQVARAGKICICEKPLCLSTKEGRTILEKVEHRNTVFVVFQVRYLPAFRMLFAALASSELGTIQKCGIVVKKHRDPVYFYDWHGDEKRSGGILFNQGIHALDLMLKICGKPVRMTGTMENRGRAAPFADTFRGSIEFREGAIGAINITTHSPLRKHENKLIVTGTRGKITVAGELFNNLEYIRDGKVILQKRFSITAGKELYFNAINTYLLTHKSGELLVDAREGTDIVSFVEKLYASARKTH
jgi:predicted dehydrogenase